MGPDLDQLFIGSEGTLGIITTAWLRAHPHPPVERRAAYHFPSFADGIEACRQILRCGATPAVLRLYDEFESLGGGRAGDGTTCTLVVLDEGEAELVEATMAVVARCCTGAAVAGDEVVECVARAPQRHERAAGAHPPGLRRRHDGDRRAVGRLPELFTAVRAALMSVPHAASASCHLSHSYPDGACLYFTFLAQPPAGEVETTYIAMWDAGQRTVLDRGGNLSHHHGIGINRSRFVASALGEGAAVLAAVKHALDPHGILNPGKLGLPSPWGPGPWP